MSAFSSRHIGPDSAEKSEMLAAIGVQSIQELVDKTIPSHIRLSGELKIDAALSEQEYLQHITALGAQNKVYKSFIGLGYNETIVPSVILRNVLDGFSATSTMPSSYCKATTNPPKLARPWAHSAGIDNADGWARTASSKS
mgnify:CR=1 FL=1